MARPTPDPDVLISGLEAWDAPLRDILHAILTNPLPVPQFADLGSLPTASSYENCIACTADTKKLYFSDGTTWKEVSFV